MHVDFMLGRNSKKNKNPPPTGVSVAQSDAHISRESQRPDVNSQHRRPSDVSRQREAVPPTCARTRTASTSSVVSRTESAPSNVTDKMLYLAAILTLSIGASTGTCPAPCQCDIYQTEYPTCQYTRIRCSSYQDNITSQFANTTKHLELTDVDDETLSIFLSEIGSCISELPFLSELTISSSESVSFNVSAESLDWIRSLTLIDIELRNLPAMFSNLPALETLDLSRNGLDSIERESFRTLTALKNLNVSANELSSISIDSLVGLHGLKCLDLSKNNLSSLDDSSFHDLSSLQYLNLSSNRLEMLNETCFRGLVQLQQIDLSWNRLSQVAPGSLQLPSLTRLLLTGNERLGGSRDVLVGTGRKLQAVDATRTGLKQVPASLTPSIHSLRLASNEIRSVNCGDLDSYPLLQLLDLSRNRLGEIEEDAMGRLESLAVLYLTDNNIREVPRSLPESLKALHLERNEIRGVARKDLQGLANLEVLELNDNQIGVIENGAFIESFALASLDLSRNPVVVLPPGSLTGPRALQVLRMSSLRVVSPGGENNFPLSTPECLITLDLSDSPGLARQFLADTATLAAAKRLQELDVSGTSLEFIRSDLLHFLPQLRMLHIKRNRFDCSRMQWLGTWLRRLDEHEYRDVLCATPPEMWGTALIDIQEEDSTVEDGVKERWLVSAMPEEGSSVEEIEKTESEGMEHNDVPKNESMSTESLHGSEMIVELDNGMNETVAGRRAPTGPTQAAREPSQYATEQAAAGGFPSKVGVLILSSTSALAVLALMVAYLVRVMWPLRHRDGVEDEMMEAAVGLHSAESELW